MAYSRYWRKNRSPHETTELALALRALRKVGGHIGGNIRPICWKGMAENNSHAIVLDPAVCNRRFPIPFSAFDSLVGEVALNGLSSMEWTEWVVQQAIKTIQSRTPGVLPYLEEILRAAEDIYTHEMVGKHIWSGYIRCFFKKQLENMDRDPLLPPSPKSLADMWRRRHFNLPLPQHYHDYYDDPNPCFNRYEETIKTVFNIKNPGERRNRRTIQLQQLLQELDRVIFEWEMFSNTPDGVDFFEDELGEKRLTASNRHHHEQDMDEPVEEKERQEKPSLSPEMAEKIKKLLEEENVDISKMVALAINDPEATVMKTCLRMGVAASSTLPDEEQVKRLRQIFRNQEMLIRKAQKKSLRRGLTEGKLDPRRLHRAAIDGRIFQNKDAAGRQHYWQICIVVDASSSMGDKTLKYESWNMAEKTLASITKAFKGTRNLLSIYAYNENRNTCRLTRLVHGGRLFTVMPKGRTPSGQAILSAAMMLDRKYKNSMMIHITDGASNCGLRLADAVAFCRKKQFHLYTIGCGCNPQTREFLTGCFSPENVFFMHDIKYLSTGIEKLLNTKMLVPIR